MVKRFVANEDIEWVQVPSSAPMECNITVTQSPTLNEKHAQMVKCLVKSGETIIAELTPHNIECLHMGVGVSGEAGELLDAIKKQVIYCKAPDLENIVEELGDLEFYMQGVRDLYKITREQTLEHNMNKLAKRYENYQYSNQKAIDRADKQ